MSNAVREAAQVLAPTIKGALAEAIRDAGSVVSSAAADRVSKEVAAVVVNQTNSEPWYQSRVTWGAILAAVAGILGIFGYAFPAEMQGQVIDAIVAAGPLISAVIVLYGRWVATKPIGQ